MLADQAFQKKMGCTIMTMHEHQPVLLKEALLGLAIRPDGIYIDGTFGRGGHAKAILSQLSGNGQLMATDKDPEAIHFAEQVFGQDSRFSIRQGSFAELKNWMHEKSLLGKVDGILLDLGVSSPQLENAERGFSFMREGPLDMRMDSAQGISAAEWLAKVREKELAEILKNYGEERFARNIARNIVRIRQQTPIKTTTQLVEIIEQSIPRKDKYKHSATRSFQAIRIFINRELEDLEKFLNDSLDILKTGGRLVIISFHSLEDRLVKRFMKREARGDNFPQRLAVKETDLHPRLKIIDWGIKASDSEIEQNTRARSATLRTAEKIT